MTTVVLLPGFGGSADQPILVKLERALGLRCLRLAPPRFKLTPELGEYVDWLEAELKAVRGRVVIVGRSFGGRLAVRLAARRRLAGVVLLGFPVRPPGKRRPLDEAALRELPCRGLVVQGTKDELGPLKVIGALCTENAKLELLTLAGAGHAFGRREREAIDATVEWISAL